MSSGEPYDAIVVGARCAGSPTAMLLARRATASCSSTGRASQRHDSTHFIQPPGVAGWRLGPARPGDRHRLPADPHLHCSTSARSDQRRAGTPESPVGVRAAPDGARQDPGRRRGRGRRRAARGLRRRGAPGEDGRVVGVRGQPRGGASVPSGRGSSSAPTGCTRWSPGRSAGAYHEKPALLCSYYAYWSGLPMDGVRGLDPARSRLRGLPTNDGLTLVISGWPTRSSPPTGPTSRAAYWRRSTWRRRWPSASRRRAGRAVSSARPCRTSSAGRTARAGRWSATPATTATRSPPRASPTPSATPSWRALDAGLTGRAVREALAATSSARDAAALPMYEMTTDLATPLQPPPPGAPAAARRDRRSTARDGRLRPGQCRHRLAPAAFFAPENLARLMAAAHARALSPRAADAVARRYAGSLRYQCSTCIQALLCNSVIIVMHERGPQDELASTRRASTDAVRAGRRRRRARAWPARRRSRARLRPAGWLAERRRTAG